MHKKIPILNRLQKYIQLCPSLVEKDTIEKDKIECIGVSPDGLIVHGDGRLDRYGLLEIKCIYSCRDGKIENCKFLDDRGKLRKNHTYYTQIQLGIWATGARYAHLFLFTDHDNKLIIVEKDTKFI